MILLLPSCLLPCNGQKRLCLYGFDACYCTSESLSANRSQFRLLPITCVYFSTYMGSQCWGFTLCVLTSVYGQWELENHDF